MKVEERSENYYRAGIEEYGSDDDYDEPDDDYYDHDPDRARQDWEDSIKEDWQVLPL